MAEGECPRCGFNNMKSPIEKNAISNEDKKTFICSSCGINENRMLWMITKNMHKKIPRLQKELQKKFREKLGLSND